MGSLAVCPSQQDILGKVRYGGGATYVVPSLSSNTLYVPLVILLYGGLRGQSKDNNRRNCHHAACNTNQKPRGGGGNSHRSYYSRL